MKKMEEKKKKKKKPDKRHEARRRVPAPRKNAEYLAKSVPTDPHIDPWLD